MKGTRLDKFTTGDYFPGSLLKRVIWYIANAIFFNTSLPFPSVLKAKILRLFGADVGRGIVIKPRVNIKYPWFLIIGSNCWIGEGVWIDNLGLVEIGNDVCLSQGCLLLTGSHNYKISTFDLMIGKIVLKNGVWIGAKAIVCQNVVCERESVLAAGSVATTNLGEEHVFQGNPAKFKRFRC